jgi:hypothetical protein
MYKSETEPDNTLNELETLYWRTFAKDYHYLKVPAIMLEDVTRRRYEKA